MCNRALNNNSYDINNNNNNDSSQQFIIIGRIRFNHIKKVLIKSPREREREKELLLDFLIIIRFFLFV